MAAPFLSSVDHFGNPNSYDHDISKPTKHNAMCDYRPDWDVIIDNVDFVNVEAMDTTNPPPETTFQLLYPDEAGRFVLVLDRSGSMQDEARLDRLKQSSTRWIQYNVADGTQIGITSFSTAASVDKSLTKVDENNRNDFVDVIYNIVPDGNTCLGLGLMKGMDVS